MKYKVKFYQDGLYEVWEIGPHEAYMDNQKVVFRGSLSDCEAWIRLHENGYM